MYSPEFSVLIVSYNSGDYLQKALDSLAGQTFRNFEIIVLDNASEDDAVNGSLTGECFENILGFSRSTSDDDLVIFFQCDCMLKIKVIALSDDGNNG